MPELAQTQMLTPIMLAASPTTSPESSTSTTGSVGDLAKQAKERMEAPVKATITILTKLYNDNMVRQIGQVIVVDIILVCIFYLITFFFFNKDTQMGKEEDGDRPADEISKS